MDWLVLEVNKACMVQKAMRDFVALKGLEDQMDYR